MGKYKSWKMEAAYVMALGIKSLQPKQHKQVLLLRWMGLWDGMLYGMVRGKDPTFGSRKLCVEINRQQVEATFQESLVKNCAFHVLGGKKGGTGAFLPSFFEEHAR